MIFEQFPFALVLLSCRKLFSISELMPCPPSLPGRLWSTRAGGVANVELVGVEEHRIAVRKIQLFFLALQPVCPLLYACDQPFANGGSEQLVLFFGDLNLVVVIVLDLVLGVFVLVLE